MNLPIISLTVRPRPSKLDTIFLTDIWNLIDVNKTWLNLLLCRHILFFLNYVTVGKDTFISLAFLLMSKKNNLFSKLQFFPQNTDVLYFLIFQKVFAYSKEL